MFTGTLGHCEWPNDDRQCSSGDRSCSNDAAESRGLLNRSIVELYESKELTATDSYEKLVDLSARLFEHEHSEQIEVAFGEPTTKINKWLAENAAIKNELYAAIDPNYDDLSAALNIFRTLFENYTVQALSKF